MIVIELNFVKSFIIVVFVFEMFVIAGDILIVSVVLILMYMFFIELIVVMIGVGESVKLFLFMKGGVVTTVNVVGALGITVNFNMLVFSIG